MPCRTLALVLTAALAAACSSGRTDTDPRVAELEKQLAETQKQLADNAQPAQPAAQAAQPAAQPVAELAPPAGARPAEAPPQGAKAAPSTSKPTASAAATAQAQKEANRAGGESRPRPSGWLKNRRRSMPGRPRPTRSSSRTSNG